jgi:hypothetical protein
MARRMPHDWRPDLEEFERRELLSSITDVMAGSSLALRGAPSAPLSASTSAAPGQSAAVSAFTPSTTSIAIPSNQGPPPFGTNLALTPTGTLTPHQLRLERFVARFTGTYTIGAGRTSTEALQTFITAAGSSNTMLHCDIQFRIITPKDHSMQIGGVCGIFDRNLNSNTSLGFDVLAPQQSVDRHGRPNRFGSVAIDVNASAGVYTEAFSQGVINVRYISSGKRTPGVIDQGTAIVTIHAQIYAPNTNFILRNATINP